MFQLLVTFVPLTVMSVALRRMDSLSTVRLLAALMAANAAWNASVALSHAAAVSLTFFRRAYSASATGTLRRNTPYSDRATAMAVTLSLVTVDGSTVMLMVRLSCGASSGGGGTLKPTMPRESHSDSFNS